MVSAAASDKEWLWNFELFDKYPKNVATAMMNTLQGKPEHRVYPFPPGKEHSEKDALELQQWYVLTKDMMSSTTTESNPVFPKWSLSRNIGKVQTFPKQSDF